MSYQNFFFEQKTVVLTIFFHIFFSFQKGRGILGQSNFSANYGLHEKNDVFFAILLNFFNWKKNGQQIFLSAYHLYQKIAQCLN